MVCAINNMIGNKRNLYILNRKKRKKKIEMTPVKSSKIEKKNWQRFINLFVEKKHCRLYVVLNHCTKVGFLLH